MQAKTIVKTRNLGGNDNKCVGYYNHLRRYPGDTFTLDRPRHFSASWMEYVSGPCPPIIVDRERAQQIVEAEIQAKRQADLGDGKLDPDEEEVEETRESDKSSVPDFDPDKKRPGRPRNS